MTAKEILQTYWHYTEFRPLQEEIIDSILAGRDTLALMPTGGGKSLCFQVPTMVLSTYRTAQGAIEDREGLCLVVTPLIALMKDQVENLRCHDIRAAAIYTGMTREQQKIALDNCQFGPYHFLYISPERLDSEEFRKRLLSLPICLLAIDEAHCISQWGYDFRPSYLHIAEIRQLLPEIPILALTATATPDVVEDIQDKLGFKERHVLQKSFHRDNLQYIVRYTDHKEEQLVHILSRVNGSAIVYVRNRKRTQEIAEYLISHGIDADFYHAGLSSYDRNQKQERWKRYTSHCSVQGQGSSAVSDSKKGGDIRVMVCTNAFGMGIDKPDVRIVIHHDLPDTLEAYYQEAGRGGRDGKTSYAVLLYNKDDKTKARKRVHDNYPPKEFIETVYHKTCDYFQIALGYGLGRTFTLHMDQLCQTMRLPILQTYSALHILEQARYIFFEEAREIGTRIRINVAPSHLSEYTLSVDQHALLEHLMRHYTGIFTDLQYINEESVSASSYGNRLPIHDMWVSLAQRGIITYIPRTVACTFTLAIERQDSLYIPSRVYEDRQRRYISRLQSMVEYAEQGLFCREQVLLGYFGELDAPLCGHCDVCIAKRKECE